MSARKGRTAREYFESQHPKPTWPEDEAAPTQPQEGKHHQGPPRNCAGKVEHKYIAEQMVKAGLEAFHGDPLDYGKLIQVLNFAQRMLKANWRVYIAEYNERHRPPMREAA